jgi:chromosome segregation ATPase
MVGLYKKALAYRREAIGPSRLEGGYSISEMKEWVSPGEEREIMSELSALSEPRRIRATDETFSFTAGRNDRRLPLLINVAAVALLLLAGLALYYYFSRRERFITSGQSVFLTTEGLLLEAVRRDAQAQIGERDQEIAAIQQRLTSLSREQEQLRLEGDTRMRQREEELQAAMSRTLEAERDRLKTQGLSAQELESQLRRLQDQIDSKNQQDLEALRRQVESERSQREAALRSLEAEFRGNLDRLAGEKTRLEEQLRQREQELGERLRRETARMESELAKSAESLARLNEQRQQEQQVSDQLLSFYEQLRGNLAKPDYEQALRTLDAFETFLAREPVASLPAMQRRRPLELFVIDSFRTLIDRQRSSRLQTTDSLLAAAEVLASLQQAVSLADQALQAGKNETARSLYLAALSKIPEAQHSHAVISRLDQEVWQAERRVLETRIETLQASSVPADQELARREQQLRQLRTAAAELQQELERVRIENRTMEAAFAEKRGRLLERLQALRRRYEESIARSPAAATTPEQELRTLLETKLLLKEVLVSEPVRTRYPELHEKTEKFLKVFGEALQKEGQLAALRDLNLIIASLAGDTTGEADVGTLGRYVDAEYRDLFYRLLDALRLMAP